MHAVLLLSVGSARPAAGLVQVGAVPLARSLRSARRARRLRRHAAGRHRDPRVGLDRRDPLHRAADAPGRDRGLERGTARRAGHARRHDRHRPRQASRGAHLMNGVHDMGGMHGFGKVEPEQNEPVFHAPWEARVIALQRSMVYTGEWNIDMSRAAQEGLPPHVYLGVSYYKRWALGMERNLLSRGLVSEDELAA